jgi:hypothetical protein
VRGFRKSRDVPVGVPVAVCLLQCDGKDAVALQHGRLSEASIAHVLMERPDVWRLYVCQFHRSDRGIHVAEDEVAVALGGAGPDVSLHDVVEPVPQPR